MRDTTNATDDEVIHAQQQQKMPGLEEDLRLSSNPEDYKLGAVIGFGASATVYEATYQPAGDDDILNVKMDSLVVAVKSINLEKHDRNQCDELRKEVQVMALCNHKNLMRPLASFVNGSCLWIVTRAYPAGSLLDIMRYSKSDDAGSEVGGMEDFSTGFKDEGTIAEIIKQVLEGLAYLHANGHIHRDIKAGNLVLSQDGTVQIADFGVAASLEDRRFYKKRSCDFAATGGTLTGRGPKGKRDTFVGTPCWMAPEVMEMNERGYEAKADIWSLGITAMELATGKAPYADLAPMRVILYTLNTNMPSPQLNRERQDGSGVRYSRLFKEFVAACLQKNPERRSSAEELLRHGWIRKYAMSEEHLVNAVLSKLPSVKVRRQRIEAEYSRRDGPSGVTGALKENRPEPWDFSTVIKEEDEEEVVEDEEEVDSVTKEIEEEMRQLILNSRTTLEEEEEEEERNAHNLHDDRANESHEEQEEPVIPLQTVRKGRFDVVESSHDNTPPSSPRESSTDEVAAAVASVAGEAHATASEDDRSSVDDSGEPEAEPHHEEDAHEQAHEVVDELKREQEEIIEQRGRFRVSAASETDLSLSNSSIGLHDGATSEEEERLDDLEDGEIREESPPSRPVPHSTYGTTMHHLTAGNSSIPAQPNFISQQTGLYEGELLQQQQRVLQAQFIQQQQQFQAQQAVVAAQQAAVAAQQHQQQHQQQVGHQRTTSAGSLSQFMGFVPSMPTQPAAIPTPLSQIPTIPTTPSISGADLDLAQVEHLLTVNEAQRQYLLQLKQTLALRAATAAVAAASAHAALIQQAAAISAAANNPLNPLQSYNPYATAAAAQLSPTSIAAAQMLNAMRPSSSLYHQGTDSPPPSIVPMNPLAPIPQSIAPIPLAASGLIPPSQQHQSMLNQMQSLQMQLNAVQHQQAYAALQQQQLQQQQHQHQIYQSPPSPISSTLTYPPKPPYE